MGYALGKALAESGHDIQQVFSRTGVKADALAGEISAEPIYHLDRISSNAELYILAVKDDAIGEVANQLSDQFSHHPLVVHTSGATPAKVLSPVFGRYGVFYPLQSFSEDRKTPIRPVPLCIDAQSPEDRCLLMRLAESISDRCYLVSDRERAILHIAAVFVNNFTNHLYRIGQEILESEGLDFVMLHPLIEETAAKIQDLDPRHCQTGPAIRGDRSTIERHLRYLDKIPGYRDLYQQLTLNINPALIINGQDQNH